MLMRTSTGNGRAPMPLNGARRVVVTGLGAVTPLGLNVADTWAGIRANRCGVGPITIFDASRFETRIAAEVHGFDFSEFKAPAGVAEVLDRKNSFGYAAALEALADAGLLEPAAAQSGWGELGSSFDPLRFGVSLGTEGRRDSLLPELAARKLLPPTPADRKKALADVPRSEYLRYSPYSLAFALSTAFDLRGPSSTISTACTSSSQALGYALRRIRAGDADVMLAGGAESLMEPTQVAGFILLGALSKRNDDPAHASRPFDADRDGFVLAEGAAMLVLEDAWHAYRRGARIYAEFAGFGASINSYRLTDSPPDGEGPMLAMKAALADAGLRPEEVDYINAHGTSTLQNDASETMAIKRCFGPLAKQIPVSSTKSMTGHMVNAAGAIEAILSVLAMRDGYLPPTINYERADPACDLDYIPNRGREARVQIAVSNSFGFGGSNGSVVLRAYPET